MQIQKTELAEVVVHHSPPLTHWERDFIDHVEQMGTAIHQLAVEKRFWEQDQNSREMAALIHARFSQTLEAMQKGNPPDSKLPEFSTAEVELADMIIQILDMAANYKWRVGEAVVAKHRFDRSRPDLNGNQY
jgi:hypothetical protein